jgi:hypothetical protein
MPDKFTTTRPPDEFAIIHPRATSRLNLQELRAYIALLSYRNSKTSEAFPSIRSLVERLEGDLSLYSEKEVNNKKTNLQRALKRVAKKGFIKIREHYVSGTKGNTSNNYLVYHLLIDELKKEELDKDNHEVKTTPTSGSIEPLHNGLIDHPLTVDKTPQTDNRINNKEKSKETTVSFSVKDETETILIPNNTSNSNLPPSLIPSDSLIDHSKLPPGYHYIPAELKVKAPKTSEYLTIEEIYKIISEYTETNHPLNNKDIKQLKCIAIDHSIEKELRRVLIKNQSNIRNKRISYVAKVFGVTDEDCY